MHITDTHIEESYPIGVNLRGLAALAYVDPKLREAVEQSGTLIDSWDIHAGTRRVAQVLSGACYSHSRFGVTKVLFEAATAPKYAGRITVHMDKKVKDVAFSTDPATPSQLLFADGTSMPVGPAAATGLIAADGVSSLVRKAAVGESAKREKKEERIEETVVPWNIKFRVLLCDKYAYNPSPPTHTHTECKQRKAPLIHTGTQSSFAFHVIMMCVSICLSVCLFAPCLIT